eukprot:gene15268-18062_t
MEVTFHPLAIQATQKFPFHLLEPVKVYVYELPGEFNSGLYYHGAVPLELRSKRAQRIPDSVATVHPAVQDPAAHPELFLHERFLSSAHRTLDPEEADFFFVPVWRTMAKYIDYNETRGVGQGQKSIYSRVIAHINASYPFWARHGGRDHMFVVTAGLGACDKDVGSGPAGTRPPGAFIDDFIFNIEKEIAFRGYQQEGLKDDHTVAKPDPNLLRRARREVFLNQGAGVVHGMLRSMDQMQASFSVHDAGLSRVVHGMLRSMDQMQASFSVHDAGLSRVVHGMLRSMDQMQASFSVHDAGLSRVVHGMLRSMDQM